MVYLGTKNCSWTSCREGCTKELFECTQIRVNYKLPVNVTDDEGEGEGVGKDEAAGKKARLERSLREYDYVEDLDEDEFDDEDDGLPKPFPTGIHIKGVFWIFFRQLSKVELVKRPLIIS